MIAEGNGTGRAASARPVIVLFAWPGYFRKSVTQLRCPRARASSCWLYSTSFDAVYGSIVDHPFWQFTALCRFAPLRFG